MSGCKFSAGKDVWPEILKFSGSQPKKAVVAYVGSDAFLRFGENDVLVVDASDVTVACGQTSASVLQRAMKRGARIFSVSRLHAKVMVFGNTAVVGSANISISSRQVLLETVLITQQSDVVQQIVSWVDDLARVGQEIDSERLRALLVLESQREPIKRSFRALAETHLVFFKEVKWGDIEKYKRQSSTAGTGGGARDLRISPADVFRPLLSQVISEPGPATGVTCGSVHSLVADGKMEETHIELWPPTSARPSEIRIARFYEVPGWAVTEAQFQSAQQRGEKLFYVLEMDVHGTVTAKVLGDIELCRGDANLAKHLKHLESEAGEGHSIIGAYDVLHNVSVP
jgi:hypothetical protein